MASVTPSIEPIPQLPPGNHPLASNASEWPSDARNAYRGVLAELDSWSRRHDSSRMLNSWIAEEAVRQSW